MRRSTFALAVLLSIVAAPEARAYSHDSVTVQSTTDGVPQDLPTELYKPDGAGPFPAIVIMHDCSGLGPRSSGALGAVPRYPRLCRRAAGQFHAARLRGWRLHRADWEFDAQSQSAAARL
jgi:hypothetical protein